MTDPHPTDRHELTEKPTVPAFLHLPPEPVERAMRRYRRRVETADRPGSVSLKDYVYDEIEEQAVIYVDGEPLAEYAAGRVDSLSTEPDE